MRIRIHILLLIMVPLGLSTLLSPYHTKTSAVLLAFATYLGTLSLSIVVYRVSPWHPLAKYPGPLPSKISRIWHTVIACKGKQYIYLANLHEKYGDIVRIGGLSSLWHSRILQHTFRSKRNLNSRCISNCPIDGFSRLN